MSIKLFTPGPTPIPERVMQRMTRPIIHHRTDEFRQLFKRVEENLRYVFQTRQPVYVLACSGTGAMEAAVANLVLPGERALTIEMGKFGARWGEICEAYGIPVQRVSVKWGRAIQPFELQALLEKENAYKAIFLTHNETSTGTALDLRGIAGVIHQSSEALVVVDGISSVGALPLKMDEWGLDVVVSASQKGFMCPPGLAFVACSDRALAAMEHSSQPRYYFDLRKARFSSDSHDTPFTPATTLFFALDEALLMMREEGLAGIWRRHHRLAEATRTAIQAFKFQLFSRNPSDTVTAVRIPPPLKNKEILNSLKQRGYLVAAGQGKIKGQIFRISHLGYYTVQDFYGLFAALEKTLQKVGWPCTPGSALRRFQESYEAE